MPSSRDRGPSRRAIPVEDTALLLTDTGGPGRPVVYLNGSYAAQRSWRRVVADLGPGYRHVTFDARGRGGSTPSGDHSFEACLRDVDAIVEATGVHDPVLVGWSYGAALAVHWADRHPERTAGVVCVDGAIPWGLTGEANRERIRRAFRSMGPFLPLARPFGLAAAMSATQHAEVNIEINEVCAGLAPLLERLTCPVRYVLGSGADLGGGAEEMERMRSSIEPVLRRNPNLGVHATVASNHTRILRRDSGAVAAAVRAVPRPGDRGGRASPCRGGDAPPCPPPAA